MDDWCTVFELSLIGILGRIRRTLAEQRLAGQPILSGRLLPVDSLHLSDHSNRSGANTVTLNHSKCAGGGEYLTRSLAETPLSRGDESASRLGCGAETWSCKTCGFGQMCLANFIYRWS